MQQEPTGVLYAICCRACGYRSTTRRPDDAHDGEGMACPQCGAAVALEWDGGGPFGGLPPGFAGDPLGPPPAHAAPAPSAEALRQLRQRHGRTQAALADCVGVNDRQVQRWEAGEVPVPSAAWQLLRRAWGVRFTEDFAPAPGTTRGWDRQRDARRDTIARGDVVELQPRDGPRLCATVTATASDAIHVLPEGDGYWAIVTDWVDEDDGDDADDEVDGFCLGERVSFTRANVIHLEQRVPAVARLTEPGQR
ncbi:helix-turn-helix domain-containing protein [Burkholderia cenocepacia]|uniref:helix-turn-helix domain-containing protein n=1 Tax=Burkholderia cenocepacia TaxID=95486 RepID=UPI002B24D3F6|nr:helix-turn-helix transcriptional regulator [Burkholderia cenocepacia]MEB2558749.1 helix-turn-helix transcriptional regulator [Burkholderia cenocepacia]